MLYIVVGSVALTAGLVVLLLFGIMPARSQAIRARMSDMGLDVLLTGEDAERRQRQQAWTRDVLKYLGEWMTPQGQRWGHQRRRLIWAGYREESAVMLFVGTRLAATALFFVYGTLMGAAMDLTGPLALLMGITLGVSGWVVPGFVLSVKITRRQKEIQKALPDALDLLVICVEAGLGLNQALVRVAAEMRHVSELMTDEIGQANLAIRAGTPREQALLDMADRTGVPADRTRIY